MCFRIKKLWLVILIGLMAFLLILFLAAPSNNRDWSVDQKVLPYAEFEGDKVHIRNIRNFKYRSTNDYDIAYYDKVFDLSKIESVWYVVEPFSDWEGAAHTFLSFGFEGSEYVAISVEVRKEQDEEYSSIKGLFRQYELMYVIGDERDIIKLRSNYRGDDVFLYPIKISKEKLSQLFVSMLNRTNVLRENPEFYNTITNTCTTNIVYHVNSISPKRVTFDFRILAPGYSDRFVYDLNLVDTALNFKEARQYFKINERALKYADSSDFSIYIRDFENRISF